MTPKEKAEDLLLKYSILKDGHNHLVKQCALVTVNEVLNDDWYIATIEDNIQRKNYWQEVKQEIQKL
jgi:hypothetical protein